MEQAIKIKKAERLGLVRKQVANVRKNDLITINDVDDMGNIIRPKRP